MTRALSRYATAAAIAAAKDLERMLSAGSDLYRACVTCHAKYIPEE